MPKETNVAADTASSIISGKIRMLQIPSAAIQAAQHGHPEAIEAYIVAYYYAALTNLLCQASLTPTQQVENDDVVKAVIDASYGDFYMLGILSGHLIRMKSKRAQICTCIRKCATRGGAGSRTGR